MLVDLLTLGQSHCLFLIQAPSAILHSTAGQEAGVGTLLSGPGNIHMEPTL